MLNVCMCVCTYVCMCYFVFLSSDLLSAFDSQPLIWVISLLSSWLQRTPLCPSIEPCSKEPLPWRQTSRSGYHLHFNPTFFGLKDLEILHYSALCLKKYLTIYRGSFSCVWKFLLPLCTESILDSYWMKTLTLSQCGWRPLPDARPHSETDHRRH